MARLRHPASQSGDAMGNLAFLNEPTTLKNIDDALAASHVPRTRLGLSQAGHSCGRFLWYKHRGYPEDPPEPRIMRIFDLGNAIEDQVIKYLRLAGMEVTDQQKEVEYTRDGISLVGHIDGIVTGGVYEAPKTKHLFECKSAKKSKFEELVKLRSYQLWNAVYFWQTQFYMQCLKLKRAIKFVYCKDDSRLYCERLRLNNEETTIRIHEVFDYITDETIPARKCQRADNYEAKWCPFYRECFFNNQQQVKSLW